MTNIEQTKKEARERWLEYFYKESQNCEQKPTHLTADTHGIIKDFIDSTIDSTYKTAVRDALEICGEDEDIPENRLKIMPERYWLQTGINQEKSRIRKALTDLVK